MKKVFALLILCFTLILITGCDFDYAAIYDDDAGITKSADSHYSYMSAYSISGNELLMTARTFIGAKTIWRYNLETDRDVIFSYSLSVSKGGKAKLVLITSDNEVIILVENINNTETEEMQSKNISLKKGNNRIKIVGYDDPSLKLILNVGVGELISR